MNSTRPADPTGPNPALMSALTTEHYTLQSARNSTIVEANGRSMLFSHRSAEPPSRWRWWLSWTKWATPS